LDFGFGTRTFLFFGMDASVVSVGFFFVPTLLIMLDGGLLADDKPTRISGALNLSMAFIFWMCTGVLPASHLRMHTPFLPLPPAH
jgi:hypothetical protein